MTLEFCGLNCQLWKCSTLYHQMHYHGIPGETLKSLGKTSLTIILGVHKMAKHTLKILQHLLQNF